MFPGKPGFPLASLLYQGPNPGLSPKYDCRKKISQAIDTHHIVSVQMYCY